MLQTTERKREILSTSQRLFKEHGYATTSVRDIAKALNIEPASLYSHIASKQDILKLTCFELAEKFEQAIKEVNDIYFNAEEKLRMAIKLHVDILTENLDASVVFIREWRNLEEAEKQEFIKLRDHYEAGIREIIQTGIDEGTFNEIDKNFAALTILSSVNWITEWFSPGGRLSSEEVAKNLSDFILTGLKADNHTQLF